MTVHPLPTARAVPASTPASAPATAVGQRPAGADAFAALVAGLLAPAPTGGTGTAQDPVDPGASTDPEVPTDEPTTDAVVPTAVLPGWPVLGDRLAPVQAGVPTAAETGAGPARLDLAPVAGYDGSSPAATPAGPPTPATSGVSASSGAMTGSGPSATTAPAAPGSPSAATSAAPGGPVAGEVATQATVSAHPDARPVSPVPGTAATTVAAASTATPTTVSPDPATAPEGPAATVATTATVPDPSTATVPDPGTPPTTDATTDPATQATPATASVASAPATTPEPGGPSLATTVAGPVAGATPAAAVPPAAAEGARPGPVVAQVVPEVTRLVSRGDGVHRITMRLQPEALGAVRVTLTVRDGEVHVRLAAGEDARRALAEGAPELRRVLELAGVSDARVVVRDLAAPATTLAPATPGGHAGTHDQSTGAHAGPGGDAPEPGTGRGDQDQRARTRGGAPATDGLIDGASPLRPDPAGGALRGVDLSM